MNAHPYLRAYMAGITLPTLGLVVVMTTFTLARHVWNVAVPIERIVVFPMAMAPNLWGLWNMLYVALRGRPRLPIGLHGAILPFLVAPIAFTITRLVDFEIPGPIASAFPLAFPVVLVVFYLLWRHFVGFLNELLGVA